MSKRIYLFVLLVLVLFSSFSVENNYVCASSDDVLYLHADYYKDYDNVNVLEEFDYSFVGEISDYISTSQFNGNVTDIPYTYFYVNVLEVNKGELNAVVVIKYYGGYNSDNTLVLLENMLYPEIDEIYQFNCNLTNNSFEDDGRTINNSLVICIEYNMKKVSAALEDVSNLNIVANNTISYYAAPSDIVIDDGNDTGGNTNTSFSTAYDLSLNSTQYLYFSSGLELYYKVDCLTLDYLTIYSTGTCDPIVYIYDSEYNQIDFSDDVSSTNTRALSFTTTRNFFYNFYADKNETYYFKVRLYQTSASGGIYLNLMKDNWYESADITELFWEYDGVDGLNKVDYTISSAYTTEVAYAINEWNKLGVISFQLDTSSTTNDVEILDYYDSEDDAPLAVTTYRLILAMTVKYNTYYFETMTQNERIKTVLHEFGHVLGLGEFTSLESDTNVMYQGRRELTKLGPADIAAYRAKWE